MYEHAWLEAAAVQLLIYHLFSFSDTGLSTLLGVGEDGVGRGDGWWLAAVSAPAL